MILNNVSTEVVKYTPQTLTDEQKAQARDNIGVSSTVTQNDVIVSEATDYTTNRVRGIALYQDTAPDAIPNGCIVGVYTIA